MTAGDVNGDGYSDILATAAFYTNAVYLFLGSAAGPSPTPFVIHEPADFSPAVGSAGDVNGDGYADILVAAQAYGGSPSNVYLHLGGPSGPSSAPIVLGGASTLTTAGDVNGDGLADIVLGPKGLVYYGASSGISPAPFALTPPPSAVHDAFANAIAAAGDINGDGFSDILVGAVGQSGAKGNAYLYLGSASNPSSTPIELAGTSAFGTAVSGAGDVNGDGFADVLLGAPGATSSTQGNVNVFFGRAGGIALSPVTLSTFQGYGFAFLELGRAPSKTCAKGRFASPAHSRDG